MRAPKRYWSVKEQAISVVDPATRGDPTELLRDLTEVLDEVAHSPEHQDKWIQEIVLKYTGAQRCGIQWFNSGVYSAGEDCPSIPGLPDIRDPLERALQSRQALWATVGESPIVTSPDRKLARELLIAPMVSLADCRGFIWAIRGKDENATTDGAALQAMKFVGSLLAQRRQPDQKSAGFRALVQSIQDYAIFTVDPRGVVTDWTEGAHRVLGYKDDEVLGKHFGVFFTDDDLRAGEPLKELEQAAREGRAERESWRVRRNGEKIWVNAISSAVRDEQGRLVGFIKVSRDLTERRRIELEREALKVCLAAELADMTQLHELSMRLFEVGDFTRMLEQILNATVSLQNADLGMIQIYDAQNEQLVVAAHQGFSDEFIRQYRVMPRVNESASGRAFKTCRRVIVEDMAREDASDTVLHAAARAAGFRALQCTPILSRAGIVLGMLATHFRQPHKASERDLKLTDLYMRLASELIARSADDAELRAARQAADMANQAKSRFLATASHDLRQPLQSLSLLSGTLRRMATNPYLQDAVAQQELAIASMSGLLNALLDVTKLDSGAIEPMRRDCDLAEIFDQMRIEFTGLAAKKGLALDIAAVPQFVFSDPMLLGQILRNLVSNALRYTSSGSVSLKASRAGDAIDVEVHDTGIGIANSDLERIFEEFFQVNVQPNSTREGHGLGLSIVRRTAAILGHKISVDSELGSGSVFRLTVPIGEPYLKEAPKSARSVPNHGDKAPHILLVDDDPGVLRATRLLLEVEGFRVTVGRTKADARQAVAMHHDIQLLISDGHLANGESGRDVIEIVRQALPRAEVILMTGDTSVGLRNYLPSDRICVASKPIDADGLLGLIDRLLRTHGHE